MILYASLKDKPHALIDRCLSQILAGGGTGGLILSPVLRALLASVGGRWTLRFYAVFNLIAGLPIAWAVPRSRFASISTADWSGRPNTHVSRSLASRPTFILSALAAFLQVSLHHTASMCWNWFNTAWPVRHITFVSI